MGQKKRRITANDRNYSGGSFNIKRAVVTPIANIMAAIGEAPPPGDGAISATPPPSLVSSTSVNQMVISSSAPRHSVPNAGGILRRISAGFVRLFSEMTVSVSATTLTIPNTSTPSSSQVAPTPMCSVVEPINVNEDGSSRRASNSVSAIPRDASGSVGAAMRRISTTLTHMFTDPKPLTDSTTAVDGSPKGRGHSKSVSETLVAMVHRGPVDRFGQGNVTHTGLDASFVDEGLHVLIDGAPNSTEFAQLLLDKLTDVFTKYTKSDDFQMCVNSPQVAGEIKVKLVQGIAAAHQAVVPSFGGVSAAASVGIAIIHRHPKDAIARLHVLNVGNTKTIVVRRQEIVFESASLMLGFHRPLRVPSVPPNSSPHSPPSQPTMLYEMYQLEAGDIVVSCTDGVTDNLYANEIIETIQVVSKYRNASWDWVAQEIAQVAANRVDQPLNRQSPFAKEAAGELYRSIDLDTELLGRYASLLRQDVNLTKTALFRNTNTRQGDDFPLDQLAQWAKAIVGTADDATVVISTI
ncbi:hypothetical protein DYB36_010455 [Aphanomyces astaci]|uniref:Protein phosphatase n=1 Tax=Aphanomyces astaci TaxID=112090 RepID=A0A397BIS4_APHAT|nr:hypothetical protein DYB36_010455 [Aphanomyces astaci]